jgi:ADP-dependent phosphofructokinase/glucokinase
VPQQSSSQVTVNADSVLTIPKSPQQMKKAKMMQEMEEKRIKDEAKKIFNEERNEGFVCIDFSKDAPNKADFI